MNAGRCSPGCRLSPPAAGPANLCGTVTDALLVAAGRGDPDAFAAFYDHTVAWVYGVVHDVLGRRGAERVTTQIYLQLWRGAPAFDPTAGSGYATVATVVRHALADLVDDLPDCLSIRR